MTPKANPNPNGLTIIDPNQRSRNSSLMIRPTDDFRDIVNNNNSPSLNNFSNQILNMRGNQNQMRNSQNFNMNPSTNLVTVTSNRNRLSPIFSGFN